MSQPSSPSTASPAAVAGATTVAADGVRSGGASRPAGERTAVRTRAARLRQISVVGVFTSVAMAGVRMPAAVIVPVMIVVLAGIDIAGGVVAKSWALGRSPWTFAAGAALFVLLFWVYGMSLRHGELSTITIGWVVLVTLADMGLDRFHYDVHFPLSKWVAALAAVALLAYLLVGTNDTADPNRNTSPAGGSTTTAPTAAATTTTTTTPAPTTATISEPTTAPSAPPTSPARTVPTRSDARARPR